MIYTIENEALKVQISDRGADRYGTDEGVLCSQG